MRFFLILSLILPPAHAAFALVAHQKANTNASPATTAAMNTAGADFLVAVVALNETFTGLAVKDARTGCASPCNTWVELTPKSSVGGGLVAIFYSANASGGPGHTCAMSVSSGAFNGSVYFAAFSGSQLTAPLDLQAAGASNTATAISPGSITPAAANELVISGLVTRSLSGGAPTVDSSMTVTDSLPRVSGTSDGGGLAYKIQTAAAAISPVWTVSPADLNSSVMASFKAGAVTVTARHRIINQ